MDVALLRTPVIPFVSRVRLLFRRYGAVALNRRSIRYLGHEFSYENRFEPFLMPSYLELVQLLRDRAGLASARTILDVGGNVGQFGAAVTWLNPGVRIWSFEPSPVALPLIERNAARTGAGRWTVHPFGIASNAREVDLWFVPGKSSQGSVHATNATHGLIGGTATSVVVTLRPLDASAARENGVPAEVDIVKVDVEGAEREALRGLAGVRWHFLLLEISQEREGSMTQDEALRLIKEIWGINAAVRWQSAPADAHVPTRDLLLERL